MTKQEFIKAIQAELSQYGLPVNILNVMQIAILYKRGFTLAKAYKVACDVYNGYDFGNASATGVA